MMVVLSDSIDAGTSDREASDGHGFQRLDRRVIRVWRLAGIMGFSVICLTVVIGSLLLWTLTPVPKPVFPLVWFMAIALTYLSVVWLPPRQYAKWSYRVDDRILELRFGIVWQVSVLIPLSRLQHVDLHRGPLERNFGLATLEIHTAGTRDASHRLPGLAADTAVRLRDELMRAANLKVA